MARKGKTPQTSKPAASGGEAVAASATGLVIADIALRGGNKLLKHTVDRVVSATAPGDPAGPRKRSLIGRLVGVAAVRIATRSVPGAIVVGGGLVAKTLYDRKRRRRAKPDDNSSGST